MAAPDRLAALAWLMPRPRTVLPGPPRGCPPLPNTLAAPTTARLERAVGRLPPMGLALRFRIRERPKAVPALDDAGDYRLRVGEQVDVDAGSEWAALAALATLAQLSGAPALPAVDDAPRFPWRGLMIDTARHFIGLATLKRTLDAMWFYKLNVLHLHLTDDQGFRFRSQAFPELASADAYSPAQLRDLVAYAADRGIRVVPELDMPGHVASWLTARPEWALGDPKAVAPSRRFGVHTVALDLAKPAVRAAIDTLLGELADVFPDQFLHFGGDEAVGVDSDVQAAFNRHLARRLQELGKRPIGWDESLHPNLPLATTVQIWRGVGLRDAALRAGFDCVVSAPYYLDLFYPAEVHYAFDPAADYRAAEAAMLLNPRLAHVREGLGWMADHATLDTPLGDPQYTPGRVLGGEACLWSELVTDDLLDSRVWSRLPAIAERFWGTDDRESLYERLIASRRTLATLGIVEGDRAALEANPDLAPLIEMLEPVKWYRRLLGEAAYQARLNGLGSSAEQRPYDADTPLNRIVDRIPPESLASRRAEADLASGAAMQHWTAGWRRQRAALDNHPALLPELRAVSDALFELAAIVDGESDAEPAPLAGPFGEYLLPIAHAVQARR